jgi:hypothetical protein
MRSAARGAFAISASPESAETAPKGEEEADAISEARFDLSTQELPPDPTLLETRIDGDRPHTPDGITLVEEARADDLTITLSNHPED